MKFTTYGDTPSKKNSRTIFVKNGVLFNFPGKKYQDWIKPALKDLETQKMALPGVFPLTDPQVVIGVFYAKDRRVFDLDNRLASVLDALVTAGVLSDDKYTVVARTITEFGGVEKDNPRAEIFIEPKNTPWLSALFETLLSKLRNPF